MRQGAWLGASAHQVTIKAHRRIPGQVTDAARRIPGHVTRQAPAIHDTALPGPCPSTLRYLDSASTLRVQCLLYRVQRLLARHCGYSACTVRRVVIAAGGELGDPTQGT